MDLTLIGQIQKRIVSAETIRGNTVGVFCWIHIHIYCLSWLIMIRLFTCVIKKHPRIFTTEVQGWIVHEAFNSELVANTNPLKVVLKLTKFERLKHEFEVSKLMVYNNFFDGISMN